MSTMLEVDEARSSRGDEIPQPASLSADDVLGKLLVGEIPLGDQSGAERFLWVTREDQIESFFSLSTLFLTKFKAGHGVQGVAGGAQCYDPQQPKVGGGNSESPKEAVASALLDEGLTVDDGPLPDYDH
ncbi:hypothetical protein ACOSQ2_005465 [Xanthoceras sorbifolium]